MEVSTSAIDLRGFADPVRDAQSVFRALLTAMSQPGLVVPISAAPENAPLPPTLTAVALTLLDYETPILLCGGYDSEPVFHYLAFHTGAHRAPAADRAAFVIAQTLDDIPWDDLSFGTQEYPDRSATVLIPVADFETGTDVVLRGPGVETERHFRAAELGEPFWQRAIANAAMFPLGIDAIFCGPDRIAALPRSAVPSFAAQT